MGASAADASDHRESRAPPHRVQVRFFQDRTWLSHSREREYGWEWLEVLTEAPLEREQDLPYR